MDIAQDIEDFQSQWKTHRCAVFGDKMQVDSVVYEHGKQLRSELAYVFAGESFSSKPKVSSETRYQLKPDQDYERHTSL